MSMKKYLFVYILLSFIACKDVQETNKPSERDVQSAIINRFEGTVKLMNLEFQDEFINSADMNDERKIFAVSLNIQFTSDWMDKSPSSDSMRYNKGEQYKFSGSIYFSEAKDEKSATWIPEFNPLKKYLTKINEN